jgi:hypothetical protein
MLAGRQLARFGAILAVVAGTALPCRAGATEVVHRLSVPRVLPCASATFLAASRNDPLLGVAVRFGSQPLPLTSFAADPEELRNEPASARLGAIPGRLEFQPGTLRLSWDAPLEKKRIWFWLRAQCGEDPEGASVNWSCDATACGMFAVYPPLDLPVSEPEWPALSEPCSGLADGRAPTSSCDAELVAVGRSLAADALASLEEACRKNRCADRLARRMPAVRALAAAREWRLTDRHPRPARLPGNEGRAWAIRLDTETVGVGLACVRMTDYEGDPLECGLLFSTGKDRLTFSRDPMNRDQYLRIPGGSATISDRVVLSGTAIASQPGH